MTILVFGSVVADMIFPLPHLPRPGETVLGGTLRVMSGGKGANQAVAAAKDGAKVAFIGAVGADALAATATAALREAGVDITGIATVPEPTACAAVCVDAEGRNQIAQAPGANMAVTVALLPEAALGEDSILLLQMEIPPETTVEVIARAREAGALIILNLAPALPLPLETLQQVDVLVVNEVEATWLMGHLGLDPATRDFDEPAPLDLAVAIAAPDGISVVVTKGERGLDAISADGELISYTTPQVKARDTTGAGDCFVGVLAAGLDRELGFAESLWRAMLAATLSCTREGAAPSFPDAAETDDYVAAN